MKSVYASTGSSRKITTVAAVRSCCLFFLAFCLATSFKPFRVPSSAIFRLHSLKPQNPFQFRGNDKAYNEGMNTERNRHDAGRGGKGRGNRATTSLENRRGARPLNKAERKAKELYEGSRLPEVQR